MFSSIKNGIVKTNESETDYISFGKGKKCLIMLPGLGDGLKTVKGYALPFFVYVPKIRKGI